MSNFIQTLHTVSVYLVYSLVLVLALQYWYFNINDISLLVSEKIDVLARIVLSVLGLVLFLKPRKLSLWYNNLLFAYWGIGSVILIEIQLNNDGVFYQWNWLNLVTLAAIITAVGTMANTNCRAHYAAKT